MKAETIRAWWSSRQGLDGSLSGKPAAEVLSRAGWSRSVGGVGPYLTLFSRAGISRQAADDAVAKLEIYELPSARGCTYVVPAQDFGLALRAGQGHGDAAQIATAKKYCGVTDAEIEKLCEAVLAALDKAPLDPKELKDATGGAVRHLGDAGKKRGMTTTLPLALGKLQTQGDIRRVPLNGRLDQQRYRYTRWKPAPKMSLPDEEVDAELARRFFRWIGPATLEQLRGWALLTVKAAKAATAALGLVPLAPDDERLMFPDDLEALKAFTAPEAPRYSLVSSLDNITHLRRDVSALLDPKDAKLKVYGEKEFSQVGALSDLNHHAIFDRGRLIGFWEYDFDARKIVWATFQTASSGLADEVARVERFVKDELGDARSFSLDSPESRADRLKALKKPGW
jgi:hypothetical protein